MERTGTYSSRCSVGGFEASTTRLLAPGALRIVVALLALHASALFLRRGGLVALPGAALLLAAAGRALLEFCSLLLELDAEIAGVVPHADLDLVLDLVPVVASDGALLVALLLHFVALGRGHVELFIDLAVCEALLSHPRFLRGLRAPVEGTVPVDQVGGVAVLHLVLAPEGRQTRGDESRSARRRDRVDLEHVVRELGHAQVRELQLEATADGAEAPASRAGHDERPVSEQSLVGLVVRLGHPVRPAPVASRRQDQHGLRIRDPGPHVDEGVRLQGLRAERPDAIGLQLLRDALVERVEEAEPAGLARGPDPAEAVQDVVRAAVAPVELDRALSSEGALDALEVEARTVRVEVVICGQARGEGRVHDVAVDLPVVLSERVVEPAGQPALLHALDVRFVTDLRLDVDQVGGERRAGLDRGEELPPVGRANDRRAGLEDRFDGQLGHASGVLGERHREDAALGAHGRDAFPVAQLRHALPLVHHLGQRVPTGVLDRHGLAHRIVDPPDVPDDPVLVDHELGRGGFAGDHRVGDLDAEVRVPREERRDAAARAPREPLRERRGLEHGLRGVPRVAAALGRDAAGAGARRAPAGGQLRRTEVTLGAHRRGVGARAGLTCRSTLAILTGRSRVARQRGRAQLDVVVRHEHEFHAVADRAFDLGLEGLGQRSGRHGGQDHGVIIALDRDAHARSSGLVLVHLQVPLARALVVERTGAPEQEDEGEDLGCENDDERRALLARTTVVRTRALAALVVARPATGLGRTLVRGGVLGVHLAVAGVGVHVGVLRVGVLVALGRHGRGLLHADDLLADLVARHRVARLGLTVGGHLVGVLGGEAVQLGDEVGDVLVERGERSQLFEPLALRVVLEVLDLVEQRDCLVTLALKRDAQGRGAAFGGLVIDGRSHSSSSIPPRGMA